MSGWRGRRIYRYLTERTAAADSMMPNPEHGMVHTQRSNSAAGHVGEGLDQASINCTRISSTQGISPPKGLELHNDISFRVIVVGVGLGG